MKTIRRHADNGRCPLCLGEEDFKHMLLDCLETINRRTTFLNGKWLGMNKEIAYRKILRCFNKDDIRNLGKYLDKIKHE
jgi:hypothetical protein